MSKELSWADVRRFVITTPPKLALGTLLAKFGIELGLQVQDIDPRELERETRITYPQSGWWLRAAQNSNRPALLTAQGGIKDYLLFQLYENPAVNFTAGLGFNDMVAFWKNRQDPQRMGTLYQRYLGFAAQGIKDAFGDKNPDIKDVSLIASISLAIVLGDYCKIDDLEKMGISGADLNRLGDHKKLWHSPYAINYFPKLIPVRPPEGTSEANRRLRFIGVDHAMHAANHKALAEIWTELAEGNFQDAKRIPNVIKFFQFGQPQIAQTATLSFWSGTGLEIKQALDYLSKKDLQYDEFGQPIPKGLIFDSQSPIDLFSNWIGSEAALLQIYGGGVCRSVTFLDDDKFY